MNECIRGRRSIFINFSGTKEKLKQISPNFKNADNLNDLTNPMGSGVYVLDNGQSFDIAIYGGCPNYVGGECRLNDDCISISSWLL